MNIWNNRNWQMMLLKEIPHPFDSPDFIYEIKFDGHRALIFASPKEVKVLSRNLGDVTNIYPELQKIKELVTKNTIFDGEIVSFQDGYPSFSKLQKRSHLKNKIKIQESSVENPVVYVCFDILYEGKDLTNKPLMMRKEILSKFKDNAVFQKTKYIEKEGIKLFSLVKCENLEGIVAKRKMSKYIINTRTDNWLKIKNLKKGIFYIGGYTEKSTNYVITLFLGEYQNNKLKFIGKVALAKKNTLYKKIKSLRLNKKSSFSDYQEKINYITPKIKCEIKYLEKTNSGHLRQPIFIKEIN